MARSRPISTRPSLPHQNQSLRFPTTSFSTLRHLHTSSPYNNNNTKTNNDESSPNLSPSPPPPTKDPNHPYLFYHTLPTSDGLIALSFLSDNPVLSKTSSSTTPTVVSKTVLGYLPMRPDAALADFSENHEFIPLLHASIKSALEDGVAKTVTFEAELRGSDGFIHIADQRKVSAQGRIPETEDILGSVFVQDGKVSNGVSGFFFLFLLTRFTLHLQLGLNGLHFITNASGERLGPPLTTTPHQFLLCFFRSLANNLTISPPLQFVTLRTFLSSSSDNNFHRSSQTPTNVTPCTVSSPRTV